MLTRIKKDFRFSNNELLQLFLTSLAFGILMALRSLEVVSKNEFLEKLVIMTFLSFLVLILHFSFEKLYAVAKGIKTRYLFSPIACGIGLYIGAIFFNALFFLSPGYLFAEINKKRRIGKFRYRTNFTEFSAMAMVGILGTLFLMGILMPLRKFYLVENFILISAFVSVLALFPIPRTDGFWMAFGNPFHYFFMLGFTLTFVALVFLTNFLLTFGVSLVLGFGAFLYFLTKSGEI
ncbi:hypothetical protein KY321_03255 [Candidatus Woesearchaeota archaeon]|nr:hypothetical protein [Candidatus Woesearchaeota archaeon]